MAHIDDAFDGDGYRRNQNDDDRDDGKQYGCMNIGCWGQLWFWAAPERWFEDRNLDLPSNCPTCKEWLKKQEKYKQPVPAKCMNCDREWEYSYKFPISIHKEVNSWAEYWRENEDKTLCWRCFKDPTRARRKLMEKIGKLRARNPFSAKPGDHRQFAERQGFMNKVQPILVPASTDFYEDLQLKGEQKKHGGHELDHIMKSGHHWEWAFDPAVDELILPALAEIAGSVEPHVMMCRSGNELVKADLRSGIVVILTKHPVPGIDYAGWRVRTGYVCLDMEDHIDRKMEQEKNPWVPLT